MIRNARVAACAVVILVLVSACGSEAGTTASPQAEVELQSAAPLVALAGSAQCRATRSGSSPLAEVEALVDGDELRVTWTASEPVKGSSVLYSATVTDYDASGSGPAYQLGVKYVDGKLSNVFVYDFNTAQQVNLDSDPSVEGSSISAVFPLGQIPGIGSTAIWKAALSLDGQDVSQCEPAL